MKNKSKKWKRNCPSCKSEYVYKSKWSLERAIKNNRVCRKCTFTGNGNGFYGKTHTKEICENLRNIHLGKIHSDETKLKMSKSHIGIIHTKETRKKMSISKQNMSDETKLKMRVSAITRIENRVGQVMPNYNKVSIPIIEQKAKELGITDLQHAENGGEYYIADLGYFLDGYSEEKNIVIEYYENFHEKNKEQDLQRQKEITNLLKCEFIIIYE